MSAWPACMGMRVCVYRAGGIWSTAVGTPFCKQCHGGQPCRRSVRHNELPPIAMPPRPEPWRRLIHPKDTPTEHIIYCLIAVCCLILNVLLLNHERYAFAGRGLWFDVNKDNLTRQTADCTLKIDCIYLFVSAGFALLLFQLPHGHLRTSWLCCSVPRRMENILYVCSLCSLVRMGNNKNSIPFLSQRKDIPLSKSYSPNSIIARRQKDFQVSKSQMCI